MNTEGEQGVTNCVLSKVGRLRLELVLQFETRIQLPRLNAVSKRILLAAF